MFLLIICSIICFSTAAQTVQVIVPTEQVVKGTAFQVQYIITQPADFIKATVPLFDSCRIVSGPNLYSGHAAVNGLHQPIQNITYTVTAQATGVLKIGNIKVQYKNTEVESSIAAVTVVAPPKASYKTKWNYTDAALYAPASTTNVDKLVAENLFIKTIVSKKTCYVGEPIVATFKLYSRLQSSSEAINTPSFYGFAVTDMLPVNEAHAAVEVVKGKIFNTAILRQVQLYPVQAGALIIDKMYVDNEIEFDDSLQHEKVSVKKQIVTEQIDINVKALPQKKPDSFTGAVGNFLLDASLQNDTTGVNETASFFITISGTGNFTQLGQPIFQWPAGMEVFDVVTSEELNKNAAPIEGKKIFTTSFSVTREGRFEIPPVSFSFFNVEKKSFVTLVTKPLQLVVMPATGSKKMQGTKKNAPLSKNKIWLMVLAFGVAAGILFFALRRKKPPVANKEENTNYAAQLSGLKFSTLSEKEICLGLLKILLSVAANTQNKLNAEQEGQLQGLIDRTKELAYSPGGDKADVQELLDESVGFCQKVS